MTPDASSGRGSPRRPRRTDRLYLPARKASSELDPPGHTNTAPSKTKTVNTLLQSGQSRRVRALSGLACMSVTRILCSKTPGTGALPNARRHHSSSAEISLSRYRRSTPSEGSRRVCCGHDSRQVCLISRSESCSHLETREP